VKRGRRDKSFAILALQAQKRADLEGATRLLNASGVRLGTAEQLAEVTGCQFGELPPHGRCFGVPLLFDRALTAESLIYYNAGDLSRSIEVDPADLVRIEDPILF
jgi:Ala-tRNA(Pro) deacylase